VARERQTFDQERQEQQAFITQAMDQVRATQQALITAFQNDFNTIDWQKLRETDPAEYQTLSEHMQRRGANLQSLIQQSAQALQQGGQVLSTRQQTETAQRMARLKSEGLDALIKAKPELADEKKRIEFGQRLWPSLKERGYTDEEISSVVDHRALLMAEEARLYRESQRQQREVELKKSPKKIRVIKAGPPKQGKAGDQQKQRATMRRALETQSDDAWADAIASRMKL
jgi:hypothetical protein